jgi:hypothetical protein
MNIEEIGREMDELEKNWFAANRAAEAARVELDRAGINEERARHLALVLARLDEAERRKREIMRQIERLEDRLIS